MISESEHSSILRLLENYTKEGETSIGGGGGINTKLDVTCEKVLKEMARTGYCCFPWSLIRAVIMKRLDQAVNSYLETDKLNSIKSKMSSTNTTIMYETRGDITSKLLSLEEPPWTLQRLCEILLLEPGTQYHTTSSFLYAVRRVVVVESAEPVLKLSDYHKTVKENMRAIENVRNSPIAPAKHETSKMFSSQYSSTTTAATRGGTVSVMFVILLSIILYQYLGIS
eukprot:TRINITY_DN6130_c0_g3_i3.p1 TRINITY_DN6130_c0_g3~~TRINITY_DN6130_c0_g3_i3.p1  ORF type:complete len:226 (-),score=17.52 TRINITY_DN6130_c0_g3_i3:342-1019(-)